MPHLPFALRSLLKTPLVTSVAILSLALGIGANAAIFSIFEQLILNSLPVEAPEQLVNLEDLGPKSGSLSSGNAGPSTAVFSYPMFRDLEQAETGLEGLAAHCVFSANLAHGGDTLSSSGLLVSGSYFDVLGVQPASGRLLGRDDDTAPGGHPVVTLAHSYWTRRFNARETVLGETLIVNGHPMTIIGVAPRGFTGTTLGNEPQIFVPLSMQAQMIPGSDSINNRRDYWIYLFGRLKSGVSLEQATAAINVPYGGIIRDVELALQAGMSDSGQERFKNKHIILTPGPKGQSSMHANVRAPLLILFCVTGFVLLIACANIANLLLVKATNRSTEIAVRLSVGAQRHQVVSQLLAESFVLAGLGSALGLLIAQATLRLMVKLMPADSGMTIAQELGPSAWIFMAVLTALTGLVGLYPALHSTRHNLVVSLKSQAGRSSASRAARRFRTVMTTVQIAISMTLLVSAGLFTRSLLNVNHEDLGIRDVEHLATFGISPELSKYTPTQSRQLFERLEEELAALPGVTGATASMVPLITGNNWSSSVSAEGFEAEPNTNVNASYNEVGPGYFHTLGIPLIAGREFSARDAASAPKVAVVNKAFAAKFGLGDNVVGKRMSTSVGNAVELDIEIVGLVPDTKYSEIKDSIPPTFFLPYRQDEELGSIYFYIRSAAEPADLLPAIRATVARLDTNLPLEGMQTMAMQLRESVYLDRMLSTLSAAFAILATILAAIGLYGVMSYSVAQRTREIGLRMALGANASRVYNLILRQVGTLTLIGSVLGIGAALGLGYAASSLLFGLEAYDPTVFGLSVLVLSVVALGAGTLPARRAALVDPMEALRDE